MFTPHDVKMRRHLQCYGWALCRSTEMIHQMPLTKVWPEALSGPRWKCIRYLLMETFWFSAWYSIICTIDPNTGSIDLYINTAADITSMKSSGVRYRPTLGFISVLNRHNAAKTWLRSTGGSYCSWIITSQSKKLADKDTGQVLSSTGSREVFAQCEVHDNTVSV